MIVVSHHVRASRLHNLHTCNFGRKCPTHSVHVKDLKTNHKKWQPLNMKKKIACSNQPVIYCGPSSWYTCFKILQKCCHSQSTPKSRSHNQIPFFFCSFKQFFFSCFPYEQLQFSRFDSHLILKSKVVWTNICVQQFSHYC